MNTPSNKKEPVRKQALTEKDDKITDNRIVKPSAEEVNIIASSRSTNSSSNFQSDIIIHMQSNGIDFTGSILLDGEIHRFSMDQNKSKKDEWYIGSFWDYKGKSYFCCTYGSWSRSDEKHTYRSWEGSSLSGQELKEVKKREKELQDQAEVEKKKNHEIAAKESADIWNSSKEISEKGSDFPYVQKKQIKPFESRIGKYYDDTPAIIVPVYNANGSLRSLQYIFEKDGKFQKHFHYLAEKKGCFHPIGLLESSEKAFICEGYATGCSIHEATGTPVIVAFDCGNLDSVAASIQNKHPNLEITIAADNDQKTPGNPGLSKARAVSEKYGCSYVYPRFSDGMKMPDGAIPTDFNDLQVLSGSKQVKKQIQNGSVKNHDAEVMGPFFLAEEGLYYRPPKNKDGEQPNPIFVSTPLEIVAITRDEKNGNHGKLLRFFDYDGIEHTWSMPLELLAGDVAEYMRILFAEGLHLGNDKGSSRLLKEYLQSVNPKERMRCVNKLGWYNESYVLPEETIGNVTDEEIVFQSSCPIKGLHEGKGTLKEWQKHVSKHCVDNSRLSFCVSAAFASPLLHILGEENGGFNLRGPSSGGKTTALNVARSVYGGPDMLHSWRATSNGLESLAALHNDSLLCLDELGKLDPKIAGEVGYHLVNGTGKQRSNRSGYARERQSWRLLFLSTGEISLPDLIKQAGQKVRGGHEVRVVDIPAMTERHGIFEDLHDEPSGDRFARMLSSNTDCYYGTAGKAFIEKITKSPLGTKEKINKCCCFSSTAWSSEIKSTTT